MAFEKEEEDRSKYEIALLDFWRKLTLYGSIRNGIYPESDKDKLAFIIIGLAMNAEDEARQEAFRSTYQDYIRGLGQKQTIGWIPSGDGETWLTLGEMIAQSMEKGAVDPQLASFATLQTTWQMQDSESFDAKSFDDSLNRIRGDHTYNIVNFEANFEHWKVFPTCQALYVMVFILALVGLFVANKPLNKLALWILVPTLLWHTFGIWARMHISGRPPVIDLYSSAVFVGWGCAIGGVILERIKKDGVGNLVAAIAGFCSLMIAWGLGASEDTLKPMRAVLDSNFWLATHVIIITLGYSAMFVAGFMGILYFIRRTATPKLFDKKEQRNLYLATYGVILFAALFSFVGTILGGIWADQSWGRFWGWDPKENGALMIVLWTAVCLHARIGGIVKEGGFMILAIGGNIITAFSWFGVNMLGIGLHSYGFMDAAFAWLLGFITSQLIIMALGMFALWWWKRQKEAAKRA